MVTFTEGEHKNEISAGKQFQTHSTIDFLFVNRSKVFLLNIRYSKQTILNQQYRNIRLLTAKNDNNYFHLNSMFILEKNVEDLARKKNDNSDIVCQHK